MDQSGYLEKEWPSKRIPPGGMLHPRKVVYSPETHAVLKVLMDEAKLTMLMRKKIDWCLRSGSSLNYVSQKSNENCQKPDDIDINVYSRASRRRPYSVIKGSGDLEREKYKPTTKAEDRELIKKRLQEIMEFGEDTKLVSFDKITTKRTKKNKKPISSKVDHIYDLLNQIQEREQWLQEMELLDEGEKYRDMIQAQVQERIKKIEGFKVSIENELEEEEDRKTIDDIKECKTENEMKIYNKPLNSATPDHNENNNQIVICAKKTNGTSTKKERNNNKQSCDTENIYKTFGEIFTNRSTSIPESTKALNKEKLRGFSIEGSPCLSAKSESSIKSKINKDRKRIKE